MSKLIDYTTALLEIAEDKRLFQEIFADLEKVLPSFLDTPQAYEDLDKADKELAGLGVGKEVKKTVGVMVREGDAKLIPLLCANFWKMTSKREHDALVTAEVRSAIALTSEQKEMIRKKLTKRVGGDVIVKYVVDPKLLGGLIVRVGDWFLNTSIWRQLELLARRIETKEHYL